MLMSKIKLLFVSFVIAAFIGLLLFAQLQWNHFLNNPIADVSSSETIVIEVKKGDTLYRLLKRLTKTHSIKLGWQWRYIHLFRPEWTRIKAGEFEVNLSVNPEQFIKQLTEAKEYQRSLTIVEGMNRYQLLDYINATVKPPLTLQDLDKIVGTSYGHSEGLFLAETYFYTKDSNVRQILSRANKTLVNKLDKLWQNRDLTLPYSNKYEALILASIIEKESSISSEKGKIASVFINRLNKGMRLQTDPTVIYGVWEEYKGDITSEHLRRKTPYNTYRINGLPPTPIAMVGLESLYAAFEPMQTDYLYFVASGDGGHVFSKSLQEHNKAVQQYLNKK